MADQPAPLAISSVLTFGTLLAMASVIFAAGVFTERSRVAVEIEVIRGQLAVIGQSVSRNTGILDRLIALDARIAVLERAHLDKLP